MAVPARHVARVEAGQLLGLDDHVLEDLVDRVADVQLAVGVRRTVVQHEQRRAAARDAQLLVDALLVPALDPARLALGQVAAHRKRRVGQVQGGAVVGLGVGHGAGAAKGVTSGATRVMGVWPAQSRASAADRGCDRAKFDRAWSAGASRCASGSDRAGPCLQTCGAFYRARRRLPRRAGRVSKRRGKPGSRVGHVGGDAGAQGLERVVLALVVQLVQQVDAHACGRSRPRCRARPATRRQWVSSSTRPPSSTVGRTPRLATPGRGLSDRPCTWTAKMPMAAGTAWPKCRFRVRKPSPRPTVVSPSLRPSMRPRSTWPLMLYGRPSSAAARSMSPAARACAHGRARHPQAMHLVALHAGHVEALARRRQRRAWRSRRRGGHRNGSRRRPARSAHAGPRPAHRR